MECEEGQRRGVDRVENLSLKTLKLEHEKTKESKNRPENPRGSGKELDVIGLSRIAKAKRI